MALGLGTEAEYNFSDLAETLLGQAQPAQFQSAGQTGYIWGSIYQDADDGNGGRTYSGNKTLVLEGTEVRVDGVIRYLEANENANIPRQQEGGSAFGNNYYYNWSSFVAESAKFNSEGQASDSICPSGWQLPIGEDDSVAKSFYNLLVNNYGLSSDESNSLNPSAREYPLSFTLSGHVPYGGGGIAYYNTYGRFVTGKATLSTNVVRLYVNKTAVAPTSSNSKYLGYTVRCVLK